MESGSFVRIAFLKNPLEIRRLFAQKQVPITYRILSALKQSNVTPTSNHVIPCRYVPFDRKFQRTVKNV